MPAFRVVIEGHNFPGSPLGKPDEMFGFFATRFVQAVDANEAEAKASALVREEFAPEISPSQSPWSMPRLTTDSVDEVEQLPDNTGAGATWFPAEKNTTES